MECESLDIDKISDKADIFITALPTEFQRVIPKLIERNKRVIDHSGDFRYKSVEVYEKWYNIKHGMPHLLDMSVYGLPELYRDKIKDAKIVANPGCYPTCSILAIAPLLKNKLIKTKGIIIDAASGITGAGRNTNLPFSFAKVLKILKPTKYPITGIHPKSNRNYPF